MEIKVKTRKLGNFIGIIIPKEIVRQYDIKTNQELIIKINEKPITRGKDLWGTMKFSKSTEELMREVDKNFGLDF